MNFKGTGIFAAQVFLYALAHCAVASHELVSPQNRFVATWNGTVVIRNIKTKEEQTVLHAVKEILWVKWVNSSTLVVAESQAGSSFCSVVIFNGRNWERVIVEPDSDALDAYDLQGSTGGCDANLLRVTFVGHKRHGLEFKRWQLVLMVDLRTKKVTEASKIPLSEADFRAVTASERK